MKPGLAGRFPSALPPSSLKFFCAKERKKTVYFYQADKVKAKFKDGVLNVNLPKEPSAQRKKIEIKS
ncbi:MAG: Hsp20 family protein [Desulfovermiculus sp.]|nr:Hsp20 family protein [Desulfovermiculus sp.]